MQAPAQRGQPGAWASAWLGLSGQSFDHSFHTVGTFNYHCTIRSGMTGTLVVN